MTVNSGDVVQFPIEQELNCNFCNDKYPEKMKEAKQIAEKAKQIA
jgi:hypothetical protein